MASSAPRHSGGAREVFYGGFLVNDMSGFPSFNFLRIFPIFVAMPFRGVGVGFEEPHLRFMLVFGTGISSIFPYFCIRGSSGWASAMVQPWKAGNFPQK